MPRKCANGTCKKVAILKRPKTEPEVLPEHSLGKRKYAQYTQEAVENAIKAIKEDKMSYRKAAKTFRVPSTTLKDKISGRSEIETKLGRKRAVPAEIENEIVDKAIMASGSGFPMTKDQFLLQMAKVVKKYNLKNQFKNGVPGDEYWRGLKLRRPDLVVRKADTTNISFKKGLKQYCVDKYFQYLGNVFSELKLEHKPYCMWNADEIGIQYCAEPVKIITKRGTQDLSFPSTFDKQLNKVFLCINAGGNAMPPLLMTKRGVSLPTVLQRFSVETSKQRTVWTIQESVCKDESKSLMMEWFQSVFLKQCGSERPQLLLMDSHGSHEMVELLDIAHEEQIHIIALPPRSSPWLEPLDRGIFLPLQRACRRISLQLLCENPTYTIDEQSWPGILCQAWDEVMTPENIKRSFEMTGNYPLDQSKIPKDAINLSPPSPSTYDGNVSTTRVILPARDVIDSVSVGDFMTHVVDSGQNRPGSVTLPLVHQEMHQEPQQLPRQEITYIQQEVTTPLPGQQRITEQYFKLVDTSQMHSNSTDYLNVS